VPELSGTPNTPAATDRDAWLARVATSLDLPDAMAVDVLEELAGHLDDAADVYRDAGLDPADADRRALRAMGDPAILGRDLGKARRRRNRLLLAVVGGGIRSLFSDGVRAYFFLIVAIGIGAVPAVLLASLLVRQMVTSNTDFLGGPLENTLFAGLALGWFSCLAWLMPARVAARAGRSVRGVRRTVAVVGLLAGTLIVWTWPNLTLSPALAVGLALGPVAFALVALRAPEHPTFRPGLAPAVALGLALALPMTAATVVLTTVSRGSPGNWEADTSGIGRPMEEYPVLVAAAPQVIVESSWQADPFRAYSVNVGVGAKAAAAQFPLLRAEAWPASVVDGRVRFGPAPVVVAESPVLPTTELSYSLPSYRTPITVSTFIVAVAPDGTRVLVYEDIDPRLTPAWRGTLADWWFGAR
jgi:hypothetical protein